MHIQRGKLGSCRITIVARWRIRNLSQATEQSCMHDGHARTSTVYRKRKEVEKQLESAHTFVRSDFYDDSMLLIQLGRGR